VCTDILRGHADSHRYSEMNIRAKNQDTSVCKQQNLYKNHLESS